jgi:spore coat protein U-like protein
LTQAGAVSERGVFSLRRIPSSRSQTVPVHSRIPAGQNVRVESYNHTVTVTVNF